MHSLNSSVVIPPQISTSFSVWFGNTNTPYWSHLDKGSRIRMHFSVISHALSASLSSMLEHLKDLTCPDSDSDCGKLQETLRVSHHTVWRKFPEPVGDFFAKQHDQCKLFAEHISGRRQMHASIVDDVSVPTRVHSAASYDVEVARSRLDVVEKLGRDLRIPTKAVHTPRREFQEGWHEIQIVWHVSFWGGQRNS